MALSAAATTRQEEGKEGLELEGLPCRGGLVTSSVLPAAMGGDARGCQMRMPGKSHFYEAIPWSPPSPGGEGRSVSARSAGFLMVQPVSGQTRCDHSEALGRMALATLLRARQNLSHPRAFAPAAPLVITSSFASFRSQLTFHLFRAAFMDRPKVSPQLPTALSLLTLALRLHSFIHVLLCSLAVSQT